MIQGERPATPTPETQHQFETWFQQEMIRQSLMAARNNDKCHDSPVSVNDAATVRWINIFHRHLNELDQVHSGLTDCIRRVRVNSSNPLITFS